jgi:hypothetical protein
MTVGPIIFSHRVPRAQLCNEGTVVTYRTSDRTTGETWWRKSRTGPKQGDVIVEEIGVGDVSYLTLAAHVEESGFASVEQWLDAIREVHETRSLAGGHLYRATAPKRSCAKCGDLKPIPTTNGLCPGCNRAMAWDLERSRTVKR